MDHERIHLDSDLRCSCSINVIEEEEEGISSMATTVHLGIVKERKHGQSKYGPQSKSRVVQVQ